MFRITRLLLIVVAAGLFAYSLHELQGRWLPMLAGTAFDISATMPDDSGAGGIMPAIFGCQAHPTWLKLIGWFAHLVVVGGLFGLVVVTLSQQEPLGPLTCALMAVV